LYWRLKEIQDTFEERVDRALEKTADQASLQTLQNISEKFNQRSGALVESVSNERIAWNHWRVNVGARHAIFLEYGTVKMSAKPFLRPAVEAQADNLYRNLRMELYGQ